MVGYTLDSGTSASTGYYAIANVNWKVWSANVIGDSASRVVVGSVQYSTQVWGSWTAALGTSTVLTGRLIDTGTTWTNWHIDTHSGTMIVSSPVQRAAPLPLTPEQIAQRETERLAMAEEHRVWMAEQEQARQTSEALLAEFLDHMQRDQLEKQKSFVVLSETGKKFRFYRDRIPQELDENGNVIGSHCIHVNHVPRADELLGLALMLAHDEKEFRRIANFTPARV